MAQQAHLLRLLAARPRTNAELQELCVDHGGAIARDMAKLIRRGDARRIDGGKGRGSRAIYAIRGNRNEA